MSSSPKRSPAIPLEVAYLIVELYQMCRATHGQEHLTPTWIMYGDLITRAQDKVDAHEQHTDNPPSLLY